MTAYVESKDFLPEDEEGVYYLGYSEVHRAYNICKFTNCRGWIDPDGDQLILVTHWLDHKLFLPFPIGGEPEKETIEKYKIPQKRSLFGM